MINTKVYNNGLKLVVEEMPNFESVCLYVMVKTGSANEKEGFYGISHFIEHMLFKGTKTRSSFDMTKEFEEIGANVNAFTSYTKTAYYAKSIGEHVEKSAELLSDMFFNSTFKDEDIEAEKKVVCEEIAMYLDNPNAVCEMNTNSVFYNDTPYMRDVAGNEQDVLSLNREKIDLYMKENYVPKNVVISFAGNITQKQAENIVQRYFLNNFVNENKEIVYEIKEPIQKANQIAEFKDNKQAVLCISYPAVLLGDDRLYTIKLLNIIFANGMSSRLFQTIREKLNLVYGISGSVGANNAYGDYSLFLSTTNKNVPLALSKIKEEIDKLVKDGVTSEELVRAKTKFISIAKMSYENTSNVSSGNAVDFLFLNNVREKEEIINLVNNISLKEVNDIAKNIFTSKRFVVSYVGPQKEIDLLKHFK